MSFKVPEKCRLTHHPIYGVMDASWGNNGAFRSVCPATGHLLNIIASDGGGWEHVSVSILGSDQTPTWEDMTHVKGLFWSAEDTVMQLHPPESEWVNNHHGCLHLWRPIGQEIPLPPAIMIGHKELTPEQVEALGPEGRKALVMAEKLKAVAMAEKLRTVALGMATTQRPLRLARPNIRNGKGLRR